MKTIQERAKVRQQQIEQERQDPRYLRVVGRLVLEKLLFGENVIATHAHPTIEEALWAGQVEPRILELLPGIILRRPKLFLQAKPLPQDLAQVVKELRGGGSPVTPFRGVPPREYGYWARQLGRKRRALAVAKTHRFTEEDQALLKELKQRWNLGESEVIRKALRQAVASR